MYPFRRPSRRTFLSAVGAVAVVATAVYATSTGTANPTTSTTVRPAANAQAANAANAAFPCDVQGLLQPAQQLAATPPADAGAGVREIRDVLNSCGVDTTPEEQFLQRVAAAPLEVTTIAERYLVQQQHVDPADFTALQAEAQHVMAGQEQVGEAAKSIFGRLGKYGLVVAVAIVVVVVALMIFGALGAQQPKDKSGKKGIGCGNERNLDQLRNGIIAMRITTIRGFAIAKPATVVTLISGNTPDPDKRNDELKLGINLKDEGAAWLGKTNNGVGAAYHAETKMATYMRLMGDAKPALDEMCTVINRDSGPCDLGNPSMTGCIYSVPHLLSDTWKQTLTVNWKTGGQWYHITLTNAATKARP
jgi:hypothetical protein